MAETYQEWKKRKYGIEPSPSSTNTSSSGSTKTTGNESYEEWKKRKAEEGTLYSDQQRAEARNFQTSWGLTQRNYNKYVTEANDFLQNVSKDYISGGKNDTAERLRSQGRDLLKWFDQYGSYFDADAYRNIVGDLQKLDSAYGDVMDFYSQFETQDAYDMWDAYSTTENRQERYEQNQKRLSELEAEKIKVQNDMNTFQPGTNPYTYGGYSVSGAGYGAAAQNFASGNSGPQAEKLNALNDEINSIKREMTMYEHGGTDADTGFYYGSKVIDYYSAYLNDPNYGQFSAEDFRNPTKDDLRYYDAMMDQSTWYQDGSGNTRNRMGDIVTEYVNADDPRYQIADPLGAYLQATPEDLANMHMHGDGNTQLGVLDQLLMEGYYGNWEQLDESEREIYYTLLGTQGKEAAMKYLSDMETELNRRNMAQKSELYKLAFERANGWQRLVMSAGSIPANLLGGAIAFVDDLSHTVRGEDINPYSAAHQMQNYAQQVRANQAAAFDESSSWEIPWIGFSAGDLYQAAMSTADMFGGAMIGPTAYGALMGMGAASSEARRLYEMGASKDQIFWGSAAAGAAEMVFEKFSIENLIDIKDADTLGKLVLNALKQGGIEASEEGATELANLITNNLIMTSESDWTKLVEANNGDKWAAAMAAAGQIGEAAAGGFVSGLIGGTGSATMNYAQNYRNDMDQGKAIQEGDGLQSLRDLAMAMAEKENGKAQAALRKQSDQLGKEFVYNFTRDRAAGRLYRTVQNTVAESNKEDVSNALQKQGYSQKEARKIADAFYTQAVGLEVSKAQQKVIQEFGKNEDVQKIIGDLLLSSESTIAKRNQNLQSFRFDVIKNQLVKKLEEATGEKIDLEEMDNAEEIDDSAPSLAVSEDGSTKVISTGKSVKIEGFASTKEGNVTLRTDSGEAVDISDISYANDSEALIYEAIASLGAPVSNANALLKAYQGKSDTDAEIFARGIQEAFQYGQMGIPMTEMADSAFASKLSKFQMEYAYKQGKAIADREQARVIADSEQAKVSKYNTEENRSKLKNKAESKSKYKKVTFEGDVRLNTKRKTEIEFIDYIASKFSGNRVHVYESYRDENGNYVYKDSNGKVHKAPNGKYVNNEIWLDLNAGDMGEGLILNTFSHEMYHHIKKWSPKKAQLLAEFLVEELGMESVDIMVANQIAKAEAAGHGVAWFMKEQNMTQEQAEKVVRDRAMEDFVADSLETMFTRGDIAAELARLKQADTGLFNEIRNFINKWVKEIKAFYSNRTISREGAIVAQLESFEKIQKMFAEAVVEAGENYQTTMQAEKNTTDDDGGEKYMVRENVVDVNGKIYNKVVKPGLTVYQSVKHKRRDYINHLKSKIFKRKFNVNDINGDQIVVEFAKENERVLKDGANNSHEVLGEFTALDDRLEMIAAINIKDLIKNSHPVTPSSDNSHKWLDAGGWKDRVAYMEDKNVVYPVHIHIPKTRDGRHLLYAVSINKEEGAAIDINAKAPTAETARASDSTEYGTRSAVKFTVPSGENLSQPEEEVKEKEKLSDRSPESVSNRSILANAFESVAKTELERQKLQEYRDNITAKDAEEQKLRHLRDQIRELSFARGPRDKQKLSKLREEAQKTENRLNIYDKRLLRLEAAKPLMDVLEREKQKAYDRAVKKGKDRIEKSVENQNKAELRKKIRKTIRDLDKLFNRGDKKRNVKEGMRDVVDYALASAEILFTDTYTVNDMIHNGFNADLSEEERKWADEAKDILEQLDNIPDVNKMDNITEWMQKETDLKKRLSDLKSNLKNAIERERNFVNGQKVSDILTNLANAYRQIAESEDSYIRGAYDADVYERLLSISTGFGTTKAVNMSLDQLDELLDAYKMVLTIVRNANKMFAENIKESRDLLAAKVMMEVRKAGGEKHKWTKAGKAVNSFSWNNEKPIYAFERIGSAALTNLYNNIRKGQDTWAIDMMQANVFRRNLYKKYGFDGWDMEKGYEFTSSSGAKFSLNLQQIMSLYAYSKREQAHDHLLKGGFVFDVGTEVVENKLGVPVTYMVEDATAYNLSVDILKDIVSKLSTEQKSFVDEMQNYLSTTMGNKGNEVSMQLYGIKLFKEQNYFPLRSAGQYMERAREANLKKEQGQVNLVSSGFTKSTTPKASNPVVLSDFMDVWAGHVNEMSNYHALVLPMEDFRRVYNYSTPHAEGEQSASVNEAIQNAYGTAATAYIDQLYRDLNGGALSDSRENLAKRMMGLFKKGSVMASWSVVFQQPSSIGRAFALVDLKYFTPAPITNRKQRWEELKKYAPVAMIKEMGYFDTGMGQNATEYLQAEEYDTMGEKVKGFFTDSNYRDEILTRPAAVADEITWLQIWNAVKNETADKHPGMNRTSEAFLKLAGERFSEVIDKTQVYDSVLARSGNMRSKSLYMNIATAFMAEPTTSINMIEDAIRKGFKGNKKQAARTMAAVATSVVINSALASIIYAARDDDEDETYAEKYISSFVTKTMDGFNPIIYYPFLKDIWSAFQGYDIERSDMSVIVDLVDTLKGLTQIYAKDTSNMDDDQLAEHKKQTMDAWLKALDSITALGGIPLRNVRRDLNGAINMYTTIKTDVEGRQTTAASLADVVRGDIARSLPVIGWMPAKSRNEKLYDAITSGDDAYAERLQSGYKSEEAYHSAIRKALRDYDPRIREAAIASNGNDYETYLDVVEEIMDEGHFDRDDVIKAIRSEASALAPEEGSGVSKAQSLMTAEQFAIAVANGDNDVAKIAMDDIIATAQENGKTESEAVDSFHSSAKNALKDQYLEDALTEKSAEKALVDFCGMDTDEAAAAVRKWEFESKSGFAYGDMRQEFLAGNITAAEAEKYIQTYGGKTADEAAETIKEWEFEKKNGYVYSDRKNAFLEGKVSASALRRHMMEYDGMSAAEADNTIRAYEWMKRHPQYDMSVDDVIAYTKPIEKLGYSIESYSIKPEVFIRYKDLARNATGVDSDGDGKVDTGSKKAEILEIINALPLTAKQKDALYYLNGWAASNLRKAPWH